MSFVASSFDDEPSISVAILSVPGRERDLERCIRAVEGQSRPADEVIVVSGQPSYVSALREAWRLSNGTWIAFLDDDSIPQHDWLEILERHLADPAVGAVGGRILNFIDGRSQARRYLDGPVAHLSWFGRTYNRLTDIPLRHTIADVDFLQGSNMCLRRQALGHIDPNLDKGMAPGFELAACQRIRQNGWRIVFNSAALVTHYPAPRPNTLARGNRLRHSRESSFVITYALLTTLSWPRRLAFMAYIFIVGQRVSPGLLIAPYFLLPNHDFARFQEAWRGKHEGLKLAMKQWKRRP